MPNLDGLVWCRNGVLFLWLLCAHILQHHDTSQKTDVFVLCSVRFFGFKCPLASIKMKETNQTPYCVLAEWGHRWIMFFHFSLLLFFSFQVEGKDVFVHVHQSTQFTQSIFPFTPFLKKHTIVPLSPQPFPPFFPFPLFFFSWFFFFFGVCASIANCL